MVSNAEHQKAYRKRQAQRRERLRALEDEVLALKEGKSEGGGAAPSASGDKADTRAIRALAAIEATLGKSDKPWAKEMRNVAREGLGWPKI